MERGTNGRDDKYQAAERLASGGGAVSRALDVIEYVVNAPKAPVFTMIQKALAIPKSSLSNLLRELVYKQYLQFDRETRVYYPGLQLIRVSAECINNTYLPDELTRGIKRLSEELGETTHAVILDGRHVVFIAKSRGVKEVSAVLNIGFRLAAHATAGGKMLLSALSPVELERLLAGVELERYTEYTVHSVEELKAELAKIRSTGYAVDNQGNVPGGFCVAAPVYDKTDRMIAAVSASVLVGKTTAEYLNYLVAKVKLTAKDISTRLGKV